jgi:hypothetical protein
MKNHVRIANSGLEFCVARSRIFREIWVTGFAWFLNGKGARERHDAFAEAEKVSWAAHLWPPKHYSPFVKVRMDNMDAIMEKALQTIGV